MSFENLFNRPLQLQKALEDTRNNIRSLEAHIQEKLREIADLKMQETGISEKLYKENINLLHIKEIYRIAAIQFARLRKESSPGLTEGDKAELEKWIGRTKSEEGLVDILDAIKELAKYLPSDIKKNIYALVQKIIIGGANSKKKEQ